MSLSVRVCKLALLSLFQGAQFKQLDKQKAGFQIRGGIKHNSKIIFLISKNESCDPSLEPSRRDGSNDGSQHTF